MRISWKYIVFALILAFLLLPGIIGYLEVNDASSLHGEQEETSKPILSQAAWFSGDYQATTVDWIKENIGFHNGLVRLHNQLDYTLFDRIHVEGVIKGKNGQFYEEDYIRAWAGNDFIGEKLLDVKMRRFRFLQQYLLDSLNISLALVIEPGKASIYPEDIPDRYTKAPEGKSNYDYILRRAAELGINLIDLNAYFLQIKDTSAYPLFPLQGTHWSEFAMYYGADSLVKYIESTKGIDLPDFEVKQREISHELRTTDYDIGKSLNLFCELDHGPMPYPIYSYHSDSTKVKPNVLAIADSYYWNFYNSGIPDSLFNSKAFWYFYNKVYPDNWYGEKTVKDIDLRVEVEKQDVILLMMTERFFYQFDRGFIDDLYSIYGTTSLYDRITHYKTNITKTESWFKDVIVKAARKGFSIEEMLEIDAGYMLKHQDPASFYSLFGPAPVIKQIRANTKWYESVRRNAVRKNISINEQIHEEAVYLLAKDHAEALARFNQLTAIKDSIMNDSVAMEQLSSFAAYYYLTEEEALQARAEEILKSDN